MNWLRYSRDVYGQETLQGISYDLFWVFAGAAALVIVIHLLYCLVKKPGNTKPS